MAAQHIYGRKQFVRILTGAALAIPAARWIDSPSVAEARTVAAIKTTTKKVVTSQVSVRDVKLTHLLKDGNVELQGTVSVVTAKGGASGAQVSVTFSTPDGSTVNQTRKTDGKGNVFFTSNGAGVGTYSLVVKHVNLARHTYNSSSNLVSSASMEIRPASPPSNQPEGSTSVRDFGARGDGVTDDSGAIQRAVSKVAESGGGTVFLPAGTYSMGSTVWMGTGVRLLGEHRDKVVLAYPMDMTGFEMISISNVQIENLTIKGTNPKAAWGYGVMTWDARNVTFNACRFTNLPDSAIYLIRSHEVAVTGCEFQTIRTSGVRLAPAGEGFSNSHVRIQENTFVGINYARIGGHSAIHCHGEPGVKNEHIWIENNHIESEGIGIGLDDVDYATVTGNRIIGNGVEGEGIAFTGSNNVISGNVINNAYAAGVLNWAVAYRSNENNVISGNTCWDNSQGIAIVCGEQHSLINNLDVRNNRCYAEKSNSKQQYGVQHYFDGASEFKWQNVRIVDNDLRGNTVWAYNILPPANATIENNLV